MNNFNSHRKGKGEGAVTNNLNEMDHHIYLHERLDMEIHQHL